MFATPTTDPLPPHSVTRQPRHEYLPAGAQLLAHNPLSVSVLVASLMEPLLAVLVLLLAQVTLSGPVERPIMVLSILTITLLYPGSNRFHERWLNSAVDISVAWIAAISILALCGFATDSFQFFDVQVLRAWLVITPLVQLAAVGVGRQAMRHIAATPEMRRPALIVGAGQLGQRVAEMLDRRKQYGCDLIGHIEDRTLDRCAEPARSRVIGRLESVVSIIRQHDIKDVYITLPLSSQPRITRLLAQLQDSTVSIYFVPDVFGVNLIQGRMRTLDGLPVVSLLESPFIGINRIVKRVSDIVLSVLILLLISPVMLLVAIGVKRSSPGPVIFKQRRHGLDGKEILVYKFRSMRAMDNGTVVKQATRGDPRITTFGAFIRRTSLDELPQFINVLQGRMSIVGPRPHAVAHNDEYRGIIQAYMVRHKVKPGITGWAQVNGLRGETNTIDKMEARVAFDLEYLRNWSLPLDLRIIARTIKISLFDKNAY